MIMKVIIITIVIIIIVGVGILHRMGMNDHYNCHGLYCSLVIIIIIIINITKQCCVGILHRTSNVAWATRGADNAGWEALE